MDKETARVMIQSKSLGVGIVLALIFGALGLFYSSIKGGLIMGVIWIICIILSFFLIGLFLLPLCHIACAIWANVAIKKHNAELFA